MRPDEFKDQFSAEWLWAEAVQSAYRKGQKDEAEEQFQRDWEKRKAAERKAKDDERQRKLKNEVIG